MFNAIVGGKKVIRKRQEEKNLEGYLERIRNVRPNTSVKEEQRQLNNGKKNMLMEDKFTEIERENRLLLEKITTTMNKRSSRDGQRQKMNKSLNSNFRRRQLQGIEIENARLLRRLQDKKSDYEADKMKQEWKKQKTVIKNIANFPLILNDGSRKQKKRSFSKALDAIPPYYDKNSLRGDIEMMRIRNFEGVNIVITIRFDDERLAIIGDARHGKDVKIIQIDRQEALQFIQQECDGKIQGLFNRLHYNPKQNVLYLMAKDAEFGNPEQKQQHQQQLQGQSRPNQIQ